jgi:hypothetical protein
MNTALKRRPKRAADDDLAARAASIDWTDVAAGLDTSGWAPLGNLLSADECEALAACYDNERGFRSTIVMARHGFGRGEYKYFAYPLPGIVAALRPALYAPLVPIANRWNEAMGIAVRYPATHADFIARCHAAGQTRPTPLLLRYGAGDYNCLHQDLYGEHAFPLQAMVALSQLGTDYTGGEFLLVENLPRAQSRGTAITLDQGQAVIWPTRYRPGFGTRGYYRITMRHGVSVLRSGHRHTLGIIFHDAA